MLENRQDARWLEPSGPIIGADLEQQALLREQLSIDLSNRHRRVPDIDRLAARTVDLDDLEVFALTKSLDRREADVIAPVIELRHRARDEIKSPG